MFVAQTYITILEKGWRLSLCESHMKWKNCGPRNGKMFFWDFFFLLCRRDYRQSFATLTMLIYNVQKYVISFELLSRHLAFFLFLTFSQFCLLSTLHRRRTSNKNKSNNSKIQWFSTNFSPLFYYFIFLYIFISICKTTRMPKYKLSC